MININDDAELAYQESMDFLKRYYGMGHLTREKLESWFSYGPPAAVAEKIRSFLEAGCTMPILRFTSIDQAGQIERFVRDVAPALRATISKAGSTVASAAS
jgi:hypothetical protein